MPKPRVREPVRLAARARKAVLAAIAILAPADSTGWAQNFNLCQASSAQPYSTEIRAQRGSPCIIELHKLGITSAMIATPPTNGQVEISGARPILVYRPSPTYAGSDRFTARVAGPQVPTGFWTFRVNVR